MGESVTVDAGSLSLRGAVGFRNAADSDTPGVGVVLELADDEADQDALDALIGFVRAIAYLPIEEGS